MTTLRLISDEDSGNEYFMFSLSGRGGGYGSVCWDVARHHMEIPSSAAWVEVVTTKTDPGDNDVWDILSDGRLEDIENSFSPILQGWFGRCYRRGERFLTVYYSTERARHARRG